MINEKDQTIMVLHQVSNESILFKRYSFRSWIGHFTEKIGYWQLKYYQVTWKFKRNFSWIPLRSITFGIFGPSVQGLRWKQHKAKEACNLIIKIDCHFVFWALRFLKESLKSCQRQLIFTERNAKQMQTNPTNLSKRFSLR